MSEPRSVAGAVVFGCAGHGLGCLRTPHETATGLCNAIAVRLLGVYREVRWTDWSEDHIRWHETSPPARLRRCCSADPAGSPKAGTAPPLVFGATAAGRPPLIVTVDEGGGVAFVVTAREMTNQEKRTYRRKAR
jgi:hypothetical protein